VSTAEPSPDPRDQGDGSIAAVMESGAPTPAQLGDVNLDLLVGDFARVVGGVLSLVAEDAGGGAARITASTGVDRPVAITPPKRGGKRRRGGSSARGGCFVGRALATERPAFETLHRDRDASLIDAGSAPLTHALAVPIQAYGETGARVLVAGLSAPPEDLTWMLWVADSYAALLGLVDRHPDALFGALEPSRRDGLTGCLTYESVLAELIREINRSDRADLPLSCCFIDLDGFKRVNDRYGHVRGNEVLADVGRALRASVRSCDTVGRYGGDEFVVILPQTGEAAAALLAERLRSAIGGGHAGWFDETLGASIGVAQWAPGLTGLELLGRADAALFTAKGKRGSVVTRGHPTASPAGARLRLTRRRSPRLR
jgi:diguanylate cyclase (GGDEF)-like protein